MKLTDKVVPIKSKPKSGGWIGGKAKGRSTNHVRRGIHLEIMLDKLFKSHFFEICLTCSMTLYTTSINCNITI